MDFWFVVVTFDESSSENIFKVEFRSTGNVAGWGDSEQRVE
jgi:hypothetical protein